MTVITLYTLNDGKHMSYEEKAPIISGTGIKKTQVDNYFSNMPTKPAPQPEPSITKTKVQAVADAYYGASGIEASGGVKKLASTVGLTTDQVKAIVKELDVLYGTWLEEQA